MNLGTSCQGKRVSLSYILPHVMNSFWYHPARDEFGNILPIKENSIYILPRVVESTIGRMAPKNPWQDIGPMPMTSFWYHPAKDEFWNILPKKDSELELYPATCNELILVSSCQRSIWEHPFKEREFDLYPALYCRVYTWKDGSQKPLAGYWTHVNDHILVSSCQGWILQHPAKENE